MKPFIFATHYWELHWLYPILKETGWAVLSESEGVTDFCNYHKIPIITREQAKAEYGKLVVCLAHFGPHKDIINEWFSAGKQVYVVQRAFDVALHVYNEFWGMDMTRFTKLLVSNDFDYKLLSEKYGEKVVLTGSARLNMASEASKKSLKKIYERVGTKKFYVATVIGGLPIHPDNLPEYYLKELPKKSPYKIVYKIHPDGNYKWYTETYPDCFFWDDSKTDVWETYKLISASQGVITPSSFLAIEATIIGKPVILEGDVTDDEYNRQSAQKQRERLPRNISSDISSPIFNDAQKQLRASYIFDKNSITRIIHEIVV